MPFRRWIQVLFSFCLPPTSQSRPWSSCKHFIRRERNPHPHAGWLTRGALRVLEAVADENECVVCRIYTEPRCTALCGRSSWRGVLCLVFVYSVLSVLFFFHSRRQIDGAWRLVFLAAPRLLLLGALFVGDSCRLLCRVHAEGASSNTSGAVFGRLSAMAARLHLRLRVVSSVDLSSCRLVVLSSCRLVVLSSCRLVLSLPSGTFSNNWKLRTHIVHSISTSYVQLVADGKCQVEPVRASWPRIRLDVHSPKPEALHTSYVVRSTKEAGSHARSSCLWSLRSWPPWHVLPRSPPALRATSSCFRSWPKHCPSPPAIRPRLSLLSPARGSRASTRRSWAAGLSSPAGCLVACFGSAALQTLALQASHDGRSCFHVEALPSLVLLSVHCFPWSLLGSLGDHDQRRTGTTSTPPLETFGVRPTWRCLPIQACSTYPIFAYSADTARLTRHPSLGHRPRIRSDGDDAGPLGWTGDLTLCSPIVVRPYASNALLSANATPFLVLASSRAGQPCHDASSVLRCFFRSSIDSRPIAAAVLRRIFLLSNTLVAIRHSGKS